MIMNIHVVKVNVAIKIIVLTKTAESFKRRADMPDSDDSELF